MPVKFQIEVEKAHGGIRYNTIVRAVQEMDDGTIVTQVVGRTWGHKDKQTAILYGKKCVDKRKGQVKREEAQL